MQERHSLKVRLASERGRGGATWLDARYTFSFADYHDRDWLGYQSLRVINEDRIAPASGFGFHGHRDMEIITWMLAGQLEHKDSIGGGGLLRPGMAQVMSAGSGIEHSETNPSRTDPAHLLQIWLRPRERGIPPRYADRDFAERTDGRFGLIASPQGRDESLQIHQDVDLWAIRTKDATALSAPLETDRDGWLHLARGRARILGFELAAGDALYGVIPAGTDLALEAGSEVLLFDLAAPSASGGSAG